MAALIQDQVRQVFSAGGSRRWSLFEVLDISGGDTINLFDLGFYRVVKQAAWMGASASGVASAAVTQPATVGAIGAFNHDAAYLLVDGVPL